MPHLRQTPFGCRRLGGCKRKINLLSVPACLPKEVWVRNIPAIHLWRQVPARQFVPRLALGVSLCL